MLDDNFILRTDSYKLTHWKQYPKDAEIVYSYMESRGGVHDAVTMFGTSYYIQKYFQGKVVNHQMIDEAEDFCKQHFGSAEHFNRAGWEYIVREHEGRLPLRIQAVAEGTTVPVNNVLLTIENTDPKVPWLTNFVESLLLKLWYPITVATNSRECKKIIKQYLELTGDPSQIDFKLHDFGYRGVSSEESASIGGAAHLLNFLGSDTIAGITMLQDYYRCATMPAFSIPASEHSTMTSWGKDHELDAYKNMLEAYPTGLVACVSDSYDIFNAAEALWGTALKDRILQRDGVLVVRPDSGDPTPTILKLLEILYEKLGGKENAKGFRVLDPHIRLIQGDGINMSAIRRILDTMKWRGWSADNVSFGMGGGLLQQVDRDSQKFAIKCSAIRRAGVWQDVFKTAVGKGSKKGKLMLINNETVSFDPNKNYMVSGVDQLEPVFEDGSMVGFDDWSTIRARAQV